MSNFDTDDLLLARERIKRYLTIQSFEIFRKTSRATREMDKTAKISPIGIQQYLDKLGKDSLIVQEKRKDNNFHQSIAYSCYEDDIELLTRVHDEFTTLILDEFVNQLGMDAAIDLLENIAKEKAIEVKKAIESKVNKTGSRNQLEQLIASVLVLNSKHGNPVLIEDEDCFILKNYNCPVHTTSANGFPCKVNEKILKELLGHQPINEGCILDGDTYCQYRVPKRKNESVMFSVFN